MAPVFIGIDPIGRRLSIADTLPPGNSNQDQRRRVGLAGLHVDQVRQSQPGINPHLRPFVGLVSFVSRGGPPFLFGIDPMARRLSIADTLPSGNSNQDQRRRVGLAGLHVDQTRQQS
ncbi:hypothetical protein [Methylomonas rosea]|uniref:Uncharacterized protein n=1 Tax=Methylomonas rosea TaxID=2952227 RepID=A0ABT1TZJ9_9GAMM|nr:hypothetical protein [Methylomonas sp. WSC-7]MCQ8119821.1 hypothetical protein [Methylomonas sp. WSC-7]